MKKKIIVLALCVLMISGCGKIPTLSNGDEAVVTLKDGSMISANEYYETLKKDSNSLDTMLEMVDKKILEEKYSSKIEGIKADNAEQMALIEQQYGDNLDNVLQQYGFAGKEAYERYIYMNDLRQLAINDYAKKQITEKEIKKYYENEVVSDIKLSHILITSKATDDMTDDEKKKAEEEAKSKAESIISELNKTAKDEVTKKFEELASAQSEDAATKKNGGSFGYINKDTLSSEYSELVSAAYKLKDGQYSTKPLKTELGYHIILRTETKAKASLEEVKDTILDKLGEQYISKNTVVYVKALQELRKDNKFEIVDSELKTKYANYIQEQLNYYQNVDEQNKQGN